MAQPSHTYWEEICLLESIACKRDTQISDLWVNGVFMSFADIMQKYNLEYKGNLWKYLQIKDCITKGKFSHNKNTLMEVLDLPRITHRVAMFYKTFNGI